jgi:long-chain acyl-CoA synthetase
MEIAVALDERMGIYLSETDIAGIQTIRDLLRLAIERRDAGVLPRERTIATDFARWLAPTGMFVTAFGMALFGLNRLVMRGLFRLRVTGAENLPAAGAFVITANHVSDLDGMAVAAALPWSRFRRLYWAGELLETSTTKRRVN